jgi:hypothetical protein
MPGKTAKSAPLPPFGLSGMTALVRAATLSCENAGNRKNARKIGSHPGNPGWNRCASSTISRLG